MVAPIADTPTRSLVSAVGVSPDRPPATVESMAESIGLTVKQFQCYARWYAGQTQAEIARELGMRYQSRVSECIGRAIARRPDLPLPPRRTGRPRGTTRNACPSRVTEILP